MSLTMKTIVVCAAIICLELVSPFPFAGPLPIYGYTGVNNLAQSHNPEPLYPQQHQLDYIQQQNENIRRQNYERLLKNEEHQGITNQYVYRPPQNYNSPPVLSTVQHPYLPLQPLQTHFQQPQYYPVQSVQYPQAPQQYHGATAQAHANAENAPVPVQPINNPYPQQYHYPQQYPQYNAQNLANYPRIQQVLATTPLKKRYLVLHPNGTIEHIDKIEHIVERHPNYVLVNAGSVAPRPNEAPAAPGPVYPHHAAPAAPATAVAQANAGPAPQAPVAPVQTNPAPTVPRPRNPPTPPPAPVPAPPSIILNGTVPGPKPTVQPPAGPTTVRPPVSAPTAQPPVWVTATATAVYPPRPTTPSPPVTAQPTPPSTSTTAPPTSPTAPSTIPPVTATATATATSAPAVTKPSAPTAAPNSPTATPVPPTARPIPPVTATATANATAPVVTPPATPATPKATPVPSTATPAPPVTATATGKATQAPNSPTTVAPTTEPNDPRSVVARLPGEPVVWFRTRDLDFLTKLSNAKENYDVVILYNVPRQPKVVKNTETTIRPDGSKVIVTTETIDEEGMLLFALKWKMDGSPSTIITTTTIVKPDGSQSQTQTSRSSNE